MTFVTSWRQSYWKFRFHRYGIKYKFKMFFPKFSEAIKLSNQAMFRRHWQQEGSGVSEFCNAIMAKWVLSWLCINTMFIEMYRGHWLKKHLLLNEGFNNYTNKICLLSVKSMIWWDTCLVNSCDSLIWWKDLCWMYQMQTTLPETLQRNARSISQLKQKWLAWKKFWSQTYNSKPCIHWLLNEMMYNKPHSWF